MILLKFWLGLAARYRLPLRRRIESLSIGFVCDLLLGFTPASGCCEP